MMAAHTWPRDAEQGELLVDGRPSVLFAVVAGVALGLVTGGARPAPTGRGSGRSAARGRLALRAALLVVMGVLLWMLPSGIAIILDAYGVMFLLLVPLLFAGRGLLAAVAVGLLIAAPLVRDRVVELTGLGPTGPLALGDDPGAVLVDWLLTGYYPALLWLPLLLAGLLCARAGLGSRRVQLLMLGLGAAACLAGYGAAAVLPGVDAEAHSGSTAELLGAGGLAIAIIGAALLALDGPTTSRAAQLVAAPLTALGRVALTVYVAHVLVIAALAPLGPAGRFDAAVGIPLLIGLSLGGIALGLALQAIGRRGPLEWLLSTLAGLPFRHRDPGARLSA
ncbi:DUF418 domain-containing protein [Microcella sp.]|uniref:DUF418 domain-containing protein n=1 Tax=Microcella sp. TaxID=1913979 RepID=UPI00391C44DD